MAVGILNKSIKSSGKTVHMPVKQSINLAEVGLKPIKVYIAIPAILLIIVLAALLSKFAVIDRFTEVAQAEAQVASLRMQLSAANERLSSYSDINEVFAHYTYSGMTSEELNRVDRGEVISLIQRLVIPEVVLNNWSISGNQLNLSIVGSSLQTLNLLVQTLNEDELVDYSTIRNASTIISSYQTENSGTESVQDVQAQIVVYLIAVKEDS